MLDAHTTLRELEEIARLGQEMEAFLQSDSFQTSLTLVKARIFEDWVHSDAWKDREDLHAELRALERLLEAFRDIDSEGVVAREATRRLNKEMDTTLSEEA